MGDLDAFRERAVHPDTPGGAGPRVGRAMGLPRRPRTSRRDSPARERGLALLDFSEPRRTTCNPSGLAAALARAMKNFAGYAVRFPGCVFKYSTVTCGRS